MNYFALPILKERDIKLDDLRNNIPQLVDIVSGIYGLDADELSYCITSRRKELVTARQMIIYILRKKTTMSFSEISRKIFFLTKSNTISAAKSFENKLKSCQITLSEYEKVLSHIK